MGIEAYKKNPQFYPLCHSGDLEGDPVQADENGKLSSKVRCLDCDKRWIEIYQITEARLAD
jgi:hypothetical protein